MKLGLVVEGGASRSYFTAGAMDVLIEKNIEADYVIGTSAGIANALSYVTKQKGRNYELATKYVCDKRYMGLRHLINRKNRSYYNLKFVFEELPDKHLVYDYKALNEFAGEIYAAVTNLKSGEAEYIDMRNYRTAYDADPLIASCALPLLFEPVKMNGGLYMDGGIADSIPYQKAIDDGCDKVIVLLTRERGYVKTNDPTIKLASVAYKRKYPEFTEKMISRAENYNRSREKLFELEKEGKVFVLIPEKTSDWGRTDSSPEKLAGIYNSGIELMNKRFSELEEYLSK